MDRSRVHILLCDHDSSSGSETLHLLRKCSYQVTAVKSARQALDILNSSLSGDVDLVLSEVELPHENGCSMLKQIMGQERLRRIPVVVMSERDEMTVVARWLRLGAVDYLVKPLRSNEVLNLWTHMWRRRRTLGMPDKHAVPSDSGPGFAVVESLAADTSESNNSNTTRLFPVVRESRKRRPVSEIDFQSEMPPHLELSLRLSSRHYAEPLTEQIGNSSPKKSSDHTKNSVSIKPSPKQIDHTESHASAFNCYSRANNSSSEQSAIVGSNSNLGEKLSEEAEKVNDLVRPRPRHVSVSLASDEAVASEERADTQFTNSSITEKQSGRSRPHHVCVSLASDEAVASEERADPLFTTSSITEKQSGLLHTSPSSAFENNDQSPSPCDFASEGVSQGGQVPNMPSFQQPYQGYFVNCASPAANIQHCGFINQPLPSPSLHLYHHESFAGLSALQTGALPPSHAFPMSNPFSFYSLAPISAPQFVPFPAWPAMVASIPAADCKLKQAERREAALNKFRLKRKDRCFEKKIRYASRKKLAEQRPRVKGQFVRRVTSAENEIRDGLYGEQEEEEDDDEQSSSELETNSSPESIAESSKLG